MSEQHKPSIQEIALERLRLFYLCMLCGVFFGLSIWAFIILYTVLEK